jgi:serine/threonine-protein kinase
MLRGPSLVGTTLGGIYRVKHLIGAGGMGQVYAAVGRDGAKVAIKVLHDKAAQDPDLVARFHREAAIAAQIDSPHIANIRGAGKEADGRLWIAFELLAGEGLDERLRREQYLSFAELAPIADDALQGLHAAHKAGVVHRDIKPANLFIEKRPEGDRGPSGDERDERTRILDFGVSKLRSPKGQRHREPSLTAFDATLGSFAYMAPEQVRGSARVDVRADLYALGVVAFRALAGRLPFVGDDAMALIGLKLECAAPTLSSITGDAWPASIEKFLATMMAREREDRFSSATEALGAWRKVCRKMGSRPRRRTRPLGADREPEGPSARTDTASGARKVGG